MACSGVQCGKFLDLEKLLALDVSSIMILILERKDVCCENCYCYKSCDYGENHNTSNAETIYNFVFLIFFYDFSTPSY